MILLYFYFSHSYNLLLPLGVIHMTDSCFLLYWFVVFIFIRQIKNYIYSSNKKKTFLISACPVMCYRYITKMNRIYTSDVSKLASDAHLGRLDSIAIYRSTDPQPGKKSCLYSFGKVHIC